MCESREADLLEKVPRGLFIGGTWTRSSGRPLMDVTDPSTGRVLVSVEDATPEDGMSALDAAVEAAEAWAAQSPLRRANVLRDALGLLMDRRDEFALLMTLEMGKPLVESQAEVAYSGDYLRWFSEEAVRIDGNYATSPDGASRMLISRRPIGPCYLITPWNFPLAMAARKIAPALAAGCTVVVKPAELTPLTSLYFAKLLEDAGLPSGVVNVIPTSTAGLVSEPILADPRLRKLSFTGSTEVGRILLRQASQNILRTSMELGGNAPFIVFEDADLDKAVDGAMVAKFRNIGQACTAANRFLIHEAVAEKFSKRLTQSIRSLPIGRGTDPEVVIGPLINDAAVSKTERLVRDAVAGGATLVTGGARLDREGTFFAPTVLTGVAPTAEIATSEIFAPVVNITTFSDEDEAVRSANDTDYGLVSYVFTENIERGHRMVAKLETGMMGLNVGAVANVAAPFGGVKASGLGREGGAEGIYEYLETKYTLMSV